MNKKLIVIALSAPPEVCGMSDYAYHTAESLTTFYDAIKLGVERMPASSQANRSQAIPVENWRQVLALQAEAAEPSDILLNYNPMSYSSWGWPSELINALKKIKKAHRSNNIFLLVHEVWSESTHLKMHDKIRHLIARYSFKSLAKVTNKFATMTEGQKQSLEALLKLNNIRLNPVSSSILPASIEAGLASARIPGTWLTFGLPGTRLKAIQSFIPLLKKMHAQGHLQHLLAIGPLDDRYAKQEAALVAAELGPEVLQQLGALPAADVSAALLTAEAALLGQDAASLHKSSSFAAMAAHGIPVIGNIPDSWAMPPGRAIFDPAEVEATPALFTSAAAKARQQLLHHWFWSNHSWEAIGKGLAEWMQQPS